MIVFLSAAPNCSFHKSAVNQKGFDYKNLPPKINIPGPSPTTPFLFPFTAYLPQTYLPSLSFPIHSSAHSTVVSSAITPQKLFLLMLLVTVHGANPLFCSR